jgi:hypothetical protein
MGKEYSLLSSPGSGRAEKTGFIARHEKEWIASWQFSFFRENKV